MKHLIARGYRIFFLSSIIFLLCVPAFFSGGRNFYLQEIVVLLISGCTLFLLKDFDIPRQNKIIYYSLLLFIGLVFLSAFFSVSKYGSLVTAIDYLVYGQIFFIASALKLKRQELFKILELFVVSALMISGVGLYYFLTQDLARVTSTFYWPNPLAGYLLFALPISLFLFIEKKSKLMLASFFVFFLTMILTGSRGAILSLGLSLVLVLINYGPAALSSLKRGFYRNRRTLICFTAIMLSLFFLISLYRGSSSFTRYRDAYQGVEFSSNIRLHYWQGAISIFKEKPLLGSGGDTFALAYPRFQQSILDSGKYVHNWVLELLAENGLFALVSFLAFLVLIYQRHLKTKISIFNSFLLLSLTASILHNLVDFDWHFFANAYIFYFCLGLTINPNLDNLDIDTKPDKTIKTRKMLRVIFIFLSGLAITSSIFLVYERMNFNLAIYGNDAEAQKYFRRSIIFNNPRYLQEYLQYLIDHRLAVNLSEADLISSRLLKADSSSAFSYSLSGELMLFRNNYLAATDYFIRAVELDGFNSPEYYYFLANTYLQQGRTVAAKSVLETNIEKYNVKILNDKKYVITNDLKLETEMSKNASLLYLLLAKICLLEGDRERAQSLVLSAQEIDPGSVIILQFSSINKLPLKALR